MMISDTFSNCTDNLIPGRSYRRFEKGEQTSSPDLSSRQAQDRSRRQAAWALHLFAW